MQLLIILVLYDYFDTIYMPQRLKGFLKPSSLRTVFEPLIANLLMRHSHRQASHSIILIEEIMKT